MKELEDVMVGEGFEDFKKYFEEKEEQEEKNLKNKQNSEPKKEKGLWPGERIFAAKWEYWVIVVILWLLGLVLTLAILERISLLVIIMYALAFLTWISLFCIKTIPENMRAKPVLLGVIGKKISYGTVIIIFPAEKLLLFPTGIQQITLTGKIGEREGAGIQTKALKGENGNFFPSIVLPVEPVLNFRWPSDDDDLTEAIKNAPPPNNLDALKDIIEELVLDIVRTIGGQKTYDWITRNRTEFSEEVNKQMLKKESIVKLIDLACLRDFTISFKHMNLPEELKKQQIEEAAATHKGEAIRIVKEKEGEGSKRIKELEGEGDAYAAALLRTKVLEVLIKEEYKDVAMLLEQLKSFTEASKTGKTTIMVPSGILDMFGSSLGGLTGKKQNMSNEEITAMIMPILQKLINETKEDKK